MKQLFLSTVLLLLLVATAFSQKAVSASRVASDAKITDGISRDMLRIISSLTINLNNLKGDLVTKTEDGTAVYTVKNIKTMQTNDQFIMVKSGGAAYYIAWYKALNAPAMPALAMNAFVHGIGAATNMDSSFRIRRQPEKCTEKQLGYCLFLKGEKVATYTLDQTKNEGTIIIGLL